MNKFRIGVDFGGTKIEIAAIGRDGNIAVRRRIPTPPAGGDGQYALVIGQVGDLVRGVEQELGQEATVGMGIPGAITPGSGLVKNANSVFLNGKPLDKDLSAALAREVRVANDANCFALSEAVDGAAAGYPVVFGVIVGTGCGGGVVVNKRIIAGRNAVAGEWGHSPLPWASLKPEDGESPGRRCFCGLDGCLETFVAGPSLARDCDGPAARDASGLPARAKAGDARARAALDRHASRLARGLAAVVNLLDPDAVVLGGGVSNMDHLYDQLPGLMARYVCSDGCNTPILRNRHGDSSGVRGAAWLWPDEEGSAYGTVG